MPFEIVIGSRVDIRADAVVSYRKNDSIFKKADPYLKLFKKEIKLRPGYVESCRIGDGLNATHLIYTQCPIPSGDNIEDEINQLISCYKESLKRALEYGCKSACYYNSVTAI